MAASKVVLKANRIAELRANVRGSVGDAVRKITLDLLSQAVVRAPVDEGPLRGSGTAHFGGERIASGSEFDSLATGDEGAQGGQGSSDTVGIIAFNTVYAVTQHERTDFNHPKGGEAKYLERPLEENRAIYQKMLADAVQEGLK